MMFPLGPLWVRKRHCRPPRQPVDLAATKDVKLRIKRVLVDVEPITQQRDPVLMASMVAVMEARENRFTLVMFTSASTEGDRVCGPITNSTCRILAPFHFPQRNS